MKKVHVESINPIGLNNYSIIAVKDNVRYKLIANSHGFIHSARTVATNQVVPVSVLVDFFTDVETALVQFHNRLFIPATYIKPPKTKKVVLEINALCKKPNQNELLIFTGKHTTKNGFKRELLRQGYLVKHVYIS